MTLLQMHNKIISGAEINHLDVLERLLLVYEAGYQFLRDLKNDGENMEFLSEDMMKLGNYIPTIGLAKSISEALLERKLSSSDASWRKENLADYKQSSKSSTTHQINLKGLNENYTYSLLSKSLTSLYFDMNTKFKSLQSVSSNIKFEIEKQLVDYTIKRVIKKRD